MTSGKIRQKHVSIYYTTGNRRINLNVPSTRKRSPSCADIISDMKHNISSCRTRLIVAHHSARIADIQPASTVARIVGHLTSSHAGHGTNENGWLYFGRWKEETGKWKRRKKKISEEVAPSLVCQLVDDRLHIEVEDQVPTPRSGCQRENTSDIRCTTPLTR